MRNVRWIAPVACLVTVACGGGDSNSDDSLSTTPSEAGASESSDTDTQSSSLPGTADDALSSDGSDASVAPTTPDETSSDSQSESNSELDSGVAPTASPADDSDAGTDELPIESIDVEALLASRCGACHDAATKTEGLDLASPGLSDRIAGAQSAQCAGVTLANPQDPVSSLLYKKISSDDPGCGDPMPPTGLPKLTVEEQHAVRDWIAGLTPPMAVGTCKPREVRVCEGVGNDAWWPDLSKTGDALAKEQSKTCVQPTQTCSADGSEWGPCHGTFPSVEDCTTEADEDCNLATPANSCDDQSWAFSVTGDRSQWFDSVAVDALGNVYILGTFAGELDFGGGPLASDVPGGQFKNDVFLGKYDKYGTHIWSKHFGDTSNQYGTQIAVDPETGDIALVMRLFGGVQFGEGSPSYVQKGSSDFVVALLDTDGNYRWSQQVGGRGLDRAERIAFSRDNGDVVVGGKVGFNADSQPSIPGLGLVTPRGQADGIVLRMGREDGEVKWYYLAGGRSLDTQAIAPPTVDAGAGDAGVDAVDDAASGDDDYVFGVDTDAAGDVYITGRFEGYFDFDRLEGAAGTEELLSGGKHDIFVVKLAGATGNPIWSRHFGGAADDRAYDLALQPGTGDVLVLGYFGDQIEVGATADAGATTLTANGGATDDDILLLSLDPSDGSTVFAHGYGDETSQFGVSHEVGKTTRNLNLAVDGSDDIYVGGFLYGSWDGRIAASGKLVKPDIFYVKLSPAGEYQAGHAYGTAGSELGYDLALDPLSSSLIVVGRFYGASLDLGPAGSVLGTQNLSSMFAAKWAQP